MGIASKTLKDNGMTEEAVEMNGRIMESDSYGSALSIIGEYVNIVSVHDFQEAEQNQELTNQEGGGIKMS